MKDEWSPTYALLRCQPLWEAGLSVVVTLVQIAMSDVRWWLITLRHTVT